MAVTFRSISKRASAWKEYSQRIKSNKTKINIKIQHWGIRERTQQSELPFDHMLDQRET